MYKSTVKIPCGSNTLYKHLNVKLCIMLQENIQIGIICINIINQIQKMKHV